MVSALRLSLAPDCIGVVYIGGCAAGLQMRGHRLLRRRYVSLSGDQSEREGIGVAFLVFYARRIDISRRVHRSSLFIAAIWLCLWLGLFIACERKSFFLVLKQVCVGRLILGLILRSENSHCSFRDIAQETIPSASGSINRRAAMHTVESLKTVRRHRQRENRGAKEWKYLHARLCEKGKENNNFYDCTDAEVWICYCFVKKVWKTYRK